MVHGCDYIVCAWYILLFGDTCLFYDTLYRIVHRLVFLLREVVIYGLGYFGKIQQGRAD